MSVAFVLRGAVEPEALRHALARCVAPVRVERRDDGVRVVVDEGDASRLRPLWLRAGAEPVAVDDVPPPDIVRPGALAVDGRWWCLARVSLARGYLHAGATLVLAPVEPADVARAVASALRPRPWSFLWPRRPRQLARACAAVLAQRDGVARASALVLASGATPAEARAKLAGRAIRSRARLARAWHALASGDGGVWRLLSDVEAWWCA